MLRPGGMVGRSSARNHAASTISCSSMRMSPDRPRRLEADHERVRERPGLAARRSAPRRARRPPPRTPRGARPPRGPRPAPRSRRCSCTSGSGTRARGRAAPRRPRSIERDDRGRQAREREQPARRAATGPLPRRRLGGRAAAPAEPVRAIPLDELHGATGERPAHVVDPPVERHQRQEPVDEVGHAVAVEVDGPARGTVEHAEHVARRVGRDVVGVLVEHDAPGPRARRR